MRCDVLSLRALCSGVSTVSGTDNVGPLRSRDKPRRRWGGPKIHRELLRNQTRQLFMHEAYFNTPRGAVNFPGSTLPWPLSGYGYLTFRIFWLPEIITLYVSWSSAFYHSGSRCLPKFWEAWSPGPRKTLLHILCCTVRRTIRILYILDDKIRITSCAGGRHNMSPPLQVDLWQFDLESGVRVTSVPILAFL